MRLSELAAFEAAYQVLQPLDAASRRRALIWLTDALAENKPLTQTAATANSVATSESPSSPASKPRRKAAKQVKATRRAARSSAVRQSASGRIYRPMPEAAEILAAYRQAGSINALAEHFDVPVHTVYSWARRLRSQGHQIGR